MEITKEEYQRGLVADSHNDRFIEKRHKERVKEGERSKDSAFLEMARAHNARTRQGLLWEKLRYHEALIQSHSSTFALLIGRHRSEVARLERLLGINQTEGEAA